MAGTDQKIMNTFFKNLGIDEFGNLVSGINIIPDPVLAFEKSVFQFDHFVGAAIGSQWGTLTNGTGAARAVSGSDHSALLTTGTADNGYAAILSGLQWYGNKNVEFSCQIIIDSVITTTKFEVGLTDAINDAGAWANDSLAENGTGNTADDCVLFIFDTDYHASTLWIAGAVATAGWGGIDTGVTIVAGSTYNFKIKLVGSTAYFYYMLVGTHTQWQWLYTKTSAITETDALCGWVFAQALGGAASRDVEIHWKFLKAGE